MESIEVIKNVEIPFQQFYRTKVPLPCYNSPMLLHIAFITLSAFAYPKLHCVPSEDSCSAYSCLERKKPCGSDGYIKKYGHPQCLKYIMMQNEVSNSLQIWFRKVRYCLQEKLIEIPNPYCAQLDTEGFDSHVECYVSTGFCELPMDDKLDLFETFLSSALEPKAWDNGSKLIKACGDRRLQSFDRN